MRVLMLSKACIVGIYQPKLEAIAGLGVDLTVLAPPSWADERGVQHLERAHTTGYQLREIPIRFNGNFHLHHYPTLGREIRRVKPQIVHIDEEPYNLGDLAGALACSPPGRQVALLQLAEYPARLSAAVQLGRALCHAQCRLRLGWHCRRRRCSARQGLRRSASRDSAIWHIARLVPASRKLPRATLHHRLYWAHRSREGTADPPPRGRSTGWRLAPAAGRRRLGA